MNFDEASKAVTALNYRDKLRLAQLLIQLVQREEEQRHPERPARDPATEWPDPDLVRYVADRLRKLKPSKKAAVLNAIAAMFQFQGGVSESDTERIFAALEAGKHLVVTDRGRVEYPNPT